MRRLISSESTLFDIQSSNFTYKLLSNLQFIKNKADDKCNLQFGAKRVNKVPGKQQNTE